MDLTPFDFELPERLIALRPVEPRPSAKLLVVQGDGRLVDARVSDLPDLLPADATLVFNDTRVLPAALNAVRPARDMTGRDVEVSLNLVEPLEAGVWKVLARPGKRLRVGDRLEIADGFYAEIRAKDDDGQLVIWFNCAGNELVEALEQYGDMPLPPYIARRRKADQLDRTHYQTKFAGDQAKSVAAPTAGLHFDADLMDRLEQSGFGREMVRLHVGLGTFAPLTEAHWQSRKLHAEWRSVDAQAAMRMNSVRTQGRKLVPVGTTAMRTLESAADPAGLIQGVSGPTDIFIRPGDPVMATDALITNFHLPRSSLFMLVSALMGTERMQAAYAHAIAQEYRFYSYGDACLLLP
ncbi:MAG: tRNA preQ1(34) S-adenosylmethionine ribosyltransferase-isomerase QueA [Hyphomonadaceae bacterium]